MIRTKQPWIVPIRAEDVPQSGRRVELHADQSTRAAVAAMAGVNGVARLDATFDLTRMGRDGLHVVGGVSATVRQTCVVTLEPLVNEVSETVDLLFASGDDGAGEGPVAPGLANRPERMVGGTVDLGAVATEFLILGIEPYPRRPGAVFEASDKESGDMPFAALAALKKNEGGSGGSGR
jgi:uncharacterized metal-binding protein YceD (DUF177 family)